MSETYQTVIIGGGLSGLTIAHKLKLYAPTHKFVLLEKGTRTGGVIATHRDQGYITEIGPHGFLDNCPESKKILTETGLENEVVKAPLIDFVRYVYLHGRLNMIPQTPLKIIMAPLIPWHAKLRVLAELWKPVLQGEPTVAKWIAHRFGLALLPFMNGVYTGTYAGDMDKLTIDGVMPGVRNLEKQYGSVLRGLYHKFQGGRKTRGEKKKLQMPAMTSFPDGMQRLPEKLTENLTVGLDLLLNNQVTSVSQDGTGWLVATPGRTFRCHNIVFATPINVSLKLLAKVAPEMPEKSIPQTWISSVVFGFRDTVKLPPGFGFLTPEQEQRFTLGALFSSNMFPGRAPEGHIVFETLIGGRRHPERLRYDDKTLTQMALADVAPILKILQAPVYSTVLRSEGGIPQLEKNYPALLKWRAKFQEDNPGVSICGFGWDGLGLNDMMKHATHVAEKLISKSDSKAGKPEIKGVYF